MKITYEHIIIAILSIALLYYIVSHYNLLSDLFRVPEMGNQQLKIVKDKHCIVSPWGHFFPFDC
jgi:hypothetical protein